MRSPEFNLAAQHIHHLSALPSTVGDTNITFDGMAKGAYMDLMGEVLRATGHVSFPGKGRLIHYWLKNRNVGRTGLRQLTDTGTVLCDFAIPYEAMVWLKQEEEKELSMLPKLLHPGQTFLDCGANIGLWSIVASDAVGAAGKVYAFEPNPTTAKKFRNNLIRSKINNVELIESAVSDAEGSLSLLTGSAHNEARIVDSKTPLTVTVATTTLDCTLKNNKVDACKIDVEGFELSALKGGMEILRQHKPWLCVEFNTILSECNRLDQWPVHQFLRNLGYRATLFTDAINASEKSVLADHWTTAGYCNLYYAVF